MKETDYFLLILTREAVQEMKPNPGIFLKSEEKK